MKLSIKTHCFPTVFHVGTLVISDKGARGSSYEGKGLSVSQNPDEWVRIAKLGGLPWHQLRNTDAKFLEFHDVLSTKSNKLALYVWGKQHGYLETVRAWIISYYDEELDSTMQFVTIDEDEAQNERDNGRKVRKIDKYLAPTAEACDKTGIAFQDRLTSVNDVLVLLLAESLDVDGVWWDDECDIYSAPRGVIFPHRLARWDVSEVQL